MYEFVGAFCLNRELAAEIQRKWPMVEIAPVASPFVGMGIKFSDEISRNGGSEPSLNEFRDSLSAIAQRFSGDPLVYVEAECFGGTCEYSGCAFDGGVMKFECEGDDALRDLMRVLGAELDDREYFAPFTRSFPWGSA